MTSDNGHKQEGPGRARVIWVLAGAALILMGWFAREAVGFKVAPRREQEKEPLN